MKYDAFISYSHAADGTLAPALQRGLHRLAKPWYALRALRVFRDETNLAAEPGLWPTIEAALSQSRFLIVMASPQAARSKWVAKELDWWLANRQADHVRLVLSEGELTWDDTAHDFDWTRTDALPRALAGRFGSEPKYVDLRWARDDGRLTIEHPAFRDAVLDLAAPISGKDKDLLDGEDVRQFKRTRRLARLALSTLAALTLVSSIAAWVALQQRGVAQTERVVAEERSRIALARQLAAQSGLLLRQNPDRLPLAVLLAVESVDRHPSFEGNQALRNAVTLLPEVVWSSNSAIAPERGRVRALAFSPRGTLLAAAREDGTAEVLDMRSRKTAALVSHDANPGAVTETPGGGIRWKAPGADAEVVALAINPDDGVLATGSNDHTARLWSMVDGHEIARLEHDDGVTSLAFHPKGPWLATASRDGNARLWNLSDGRLLHRFEAGQSVSEVLFSPNGRYLAAINTGACVQLVDLEATAMPMRKWCHGSSGFGLAFSADSARLATTTGDRANVYKAATGERLFEATHLSRRNDGEPAHFRWITQVAFSPDGESLATAGRDGTARVWDLINGQEIVRLQHRAGVEALTFGTVGAHLLTASVDGTARVWDLPSGRERLRNVHRGGSEVVAFSPDGRLVASGGVAGTISLWRLTSADQPLNFAHAGDAAVKSALSIGAVCMAPDDRQLVSVDRNGELRVWSAAGELVASQTKLYGADSLVFSEDGRYLIVRARNPPISLLDLQHGLAPVELEGSDGVSDVVASGRFIVARDRERRLRVWESAGGKLLPLEDDRDPWGIVVAAGQRHVATMHQQDRGPTVIRVRTLPEMKETGRIMVGAQTVFGLSPDGARLAVSIFERPDSSQPGQRHVDLFDVATGRRMMRIDENRSLDRLNFSPDGRRLFVIGESFGDQRRELRIWRVADGRLEASLRHETEIDDARVSTRGDVLATRTGDQIHVWDISDGNGGVLMSQVEGDPWFSAFTFTHDGRRLLTGSRDGKVVSWLWRTEDLREETCRRVPRNLDTDEWARYLGDQPYRATCATLPMGSSALPTSIDTKPSAPR